MDILTVIGLILGLAVVVGGQVLEGGSLEAIFQPTAVLIVFGGTFAALFVQYSIGTVIRSVALVGSTFVSPKDNLQELITDITGFARHAHRHGLLSLENKAKHIADPFFNKALQLVVDGSGLEELKSILEIEIDYDDERRLTASRVFESAGGYAPTLGILGAVLGLIQVMENLADPSNLGQGIAVAFVATVYGVASANLFWLPFAGKIRQRARDEAIRKELILEGMLSLASGESPRLIQERLNGFLVKADGKTK